MVNTGELLVEENLTRCYGVNCNQHWYPIEVGWDTSYNTPTWWLGIVGNRINATGVAPGLDRE